ncbi:hypothetical protein MMC18_000397 [Xylographa bjoerkii]|nr:hypothetical protein [Xylographa bjoerkii]
MADPLSTLASLIAIVQISGSIVSICYDYRSAVKKACKDQVRLTEEVKSLRDVLEGLVALADQDSSGDSRLPMINTLNQKDGPLEQCKSELKALEAKLRPASGWKAVGKALKWPLSEPEVVKSLTSLNRLKATLMLALTTDQMVVSLAIQDETQRIKTYTERLTEEVDSIRKLEERKQIMIWLAAPDCTRNYVTARKKRQDGTGLWLLSDERYTRWKTAKDSLLWIHGIPGCGKTVLSALVVDDITQYCQSSKAFGVAYFYFDFNDDCQQSPESFLRSTIAQLVVQSSTAMRDLEDYYRTATYKPFFENYRDGKLTTIDLIALLRLCLSAFDHTFLVLDALDECRDRGDLLSLISQIECLEPSKLNILMTSRTEKDFEDKFQHLRPVEIGLHSTLIEPDIRTYVEQSMKDQPQLRRWTLELQAEVQHVLLEGAQGMFRWVECQLDALRKCLKPQAVKKALRSLPKTLDETYGSIVSRMDIDYKEDARRILQFVAFSGRPVRLDEVVEVLAIDLDEPDFRFDPGNRLTDARDILTICSCLITITPSSTEYGLEEVRLAHSTVKDYLTSVHFPTRSTSEHDIGFEESGSHQFIARICLTYLIYLDDSHLQEPELGSKFPLAKYAATYWIQHYHAASEKDPLQSLVLSLFTDVTGCYANWRMLHDIDKPWLSSDSYGKSSIGSPLYYASLAGLDSIVASLLQSGANPNERGGVFGDPLQAAVYQNYPSIVCSLLEHGSDPNLWGGQMCSAFMAACIQGRKDMISILVTKGADVNISDFSDGSALLLAADRGHDDVVRQLLDFGADINERVGKRGTALHAAATQGHLSMCKLLVERGAIIDADDRWLENDVQAAANRGYVDIVNCFLDAGVKPKAGADVNSCNKYDSPALVEAARAGDDSIVQLLLDKNAAINAQGEYWGTALHAAAHCGHLSLVQLLLDHNPPADVNARGGLYSNASDFGTVLHNAAISGELAVVVLILDKGAIIDAEGGEYGTALQAASFHAHLDIVRFLVSKGASVNLIGGYYGTALQAASASGNITIVRELLDHGANPNAQGGEHNTALEAAAHVGHANMVQCLLDGGAHPDAAGTSESSLLSPGWDVTGALGTAARLGFTAIALQLCDAGADFTLVDTHSQRTPLQQTAAAGQLEVMKAFLQRGARLKNSDLLLQAIPTFNSKNNLQMIEFLLAAGADPNARSSDENGSGPLQLAVRVGSTSVVRVLLSNGADVNQQNDDGWTALHEAAKEGHVELVRQLIEEHNADLGLRLINGSLPLHLAAQHGQHSCVAVLLQKGIDVNTTNNDGRTALHTAIDHKQGVVVRTLLDAGADIMIEDSRAGMTAIDLAEFKLTTGDAVHWNVPQKEIVESLRAHLAKGGMKESGEKVD